MKKSANVYYHVWFVTKYRKPVLVEDIDSIVKDVFAQCIERHDYKVLEYETNIDHVHMLVEAKSKADLAGIVRTLKAVSAKEVLRITRLRAGKGSHFWARRYGYKKVPERLAPVVRRYIRKQKKTPHFRVGKEGSPTLPCGEC